MCDSNYVRYLKSSESETGVSWLLPGAGLRVRGELLFNGVKVQFDKMSVTGLMVLLAARSCMCVIPELCT